MTLLIEHCDLCQHSNSVNLFTTCKICKKMVCFECTASIGETKAFADETNNRGNVWSYPKDPKSSKEFGEYNDFVCYKCFHDVMNKPVKIVDKKMLRRIHEEALLEIHGDVYKPFVKRVKRDVVLGSV